MSSVAGPSSLPAYPLPSSKDAIRQTPCLSAIYPNPAHPVHKALLSKLSLNTDSVTLYGFEQGGVVINPSSSQSDPKSWGQARGYLIITSTTKRQVDQIKVELVTRQKIMFPQDRGKMEEDVVCTRQVAFGDRQSGGVSLTQGLNTFEYLIHVPPDACVTEWANMVPKTERTDEVLKTHTFRIANFVVATVVGSAKGLFGKDLVAEKEIWIGDAPEDREELALNLHVEGLQADLGLCTLDVSSSLFIVAGAISLSLTLHSPPPTLKVYAIKAHVDQTIQLASYRDPRKTATLKHKGMLLERGWSGPYTTKALQELRSGGLEEGRLLFDASKSGEGWAAEEVARIPNARELSGTTHPNTVTCVRASSELVVELFFTTSGDDANQSDKVRIATVMRKPVHLGSCGLLPARLDLPDYVPGPAVLPDFLRTRIPCQCDELDDHKVLQVERDHLLRRRQAVADDRDMLLKSPDGRKVGEIN